MDSNVFLGLSKKRGQDLAESLNVVFQLIRIDQEEYFSYPSEQERSDRVFIEIEQGKIVKATVM